MATTILNSTYTEGIVQADGRRSVKERYTDSSGQVYEFEWFGNQDAALVVSARAAKLNEHLAARDAAEALVVGTMLPLTVVEFRDLFTRDEIVAIDKFNAQFEGDTSLPGRIKDVIRSGLEDYRRASKIPRPFDPRVRSMLEMYVDFGLIARARVEEILAAGKG